MKVKLGQDVSMMFMKGYRKTVVKGVAGDEIEIEDFVMNRFNEAGIKYSLCEESKPQEIKTEVKSAGKKR